MSPPFIERSNQRQLPSDYDGPVLFWDIDKTYLNTHFSSLRGLLAIPFEMAVDKEPMPGAVELLRGLRRGPQEESRITPLYFVSGSPPQLRATIERRMIFDAVDFDGITFKDQGRLLRRGYIGDIKGQVGYKLLALLLYASELPPQSHWYCFGDDVESDAEIFSLFHRVCAGFRGDELQKHLQANGVRTWALDPIMAVAGALPTMSEKVSAVLIHRYGRNKKGHAVHSAPGALPPVFACDSYIQTAMVLWAQNMISAATVRKVADDLRRHDLQAKDLEVQVQSAIEDFGLPKDIWQRAMAAGDTD